MSTRRIPAEAFPPGEFLRDVLEQRGWTQGEFAEIIGRPPQLVNEIIAGKRGITPETAKEFAAALDTSPEYWMNLETAYQLAKTPSVVLDGITRHAMLRQWFPVREMMKRGWIATSKIPSEIEKNVLAFFGLGSFGDTVGFGKPAWRKGGADVAGIQWAWLYRVRQVATALRVCPFSEDKLREAIPELERLMMEPEEIRHVPRILSECGVRFVVVEPIPGSEIGGVCFWLDGQPVIGLSLKGDHIDKFWFNLWHEIEHVLNGDGKDTNEVMIDDFDGAANDIECERVANETAANRCVPSSSMNDFIARHNPMFAEKNFIGFCRLMKRHPGIVAGQIQKRIGRWDLFKKHQVRVRHIVTETALTDGYGRNVPSDL